jgi:hypothetical protein
MHMRVDCVYLLDGGLQFGASHIAGEVDDLPLQVE